MAHSKSAAVRAKLGHPVIDGDGHWLEPVPIFLDYLRDVGGPSAVDKFMKKAKDTSWYEMSAADRMDRRPHRPTWWGEPASTLDRATAMIPRLFYERLDDFGIASCSFIKIDVEGHEEAVLDGASTLIAAQRPVLMVELNEDYNPGVVKRLAARYAALRYAGLFLSHGKLHPIEQFDPAVHQDLALLKYPRHKLPPGREYINNVLFVPEERSELLPDHA